ncbi:MAG: hypothetical protein KDA79_22720 [Planctomycetaceae bacterium]|nr:hypothetical protein [Planctomycetaceae bacterium]
MLAQDLSQPAAAAAGWKVQVSFPAEVHQKPFTGRVYVFFSRQREEPRTGPGWFRPELFVSQDVMKWPPGEPLEFSPATRKTGLSTPSLPAPFDPAGYRAQAVIRFNPYEREVGTGTGNGFSRVAIMPAGESGETVSLEVNQLVPPRKFENTRWSREFRVRSELLSRFHQRDVFVKGCVTLPASWYDDAERRYPVIFAIPGFGGTHFMGRRTEPIAENNPQGVEFLRVTLDPSCPLGHHVFADSDNNGPWGRALVDEFLPAFDREFRTIPEAESRFLTGHSSGGWSSLWLQIQHPTTFGGTWSTAPDPVDFRDYQQVNLYQPGNNIYTDGNGQPRPLARSGEQVLLWYRDFAGMEWSLGHGGQLHSFEAVFSPQSATGRPQLLFDRRTGEIDLEVARSWEKYDIRLNLERNWPRLKQPLAGKLHVFMGDQDTFYLEGAAVLLKKALADLGSDAVVEIHPGRDHSNLLAGGLRERIRQEMVETFLATRPAQP